MAAPSATGLSLKLETVTRKEEEREEEETNIDLVYEKPDIIIDSEDKEKLIYEQVEDREKDVTVNETVKYITVKEEESSKEEEAIGYKVKKKKIIEVHKSKKEKKKKKNFVEKGLTSIKGNIKGFLKSGTLNKLQAGLHAVTLLALIPLIGLSGRILQQTSQQPVTNDTNTSSGVMEFAGQVNAAIEQVLGNVTNDALVELANQVMAANMELHEQANDIINATQRTGDNMDQVEGLVLEQVEVSQNKSLVLNELIKSTVDTMNRLNNITATLSNISNNSKSSAEVVNDLLTVVNELARIQNVTDQLVKEPMSCKDIKLRLPNSITGYYFINNRPIYCDMGELCGSGEGWTRLGYLDMTDATQNCPSEFRLYPTNVIRACGRPETFNSSGNCASVQFPSYGISYSQICGRVTGYQFGHPDASHIPSSSYRNDINAPYVDGVSITRGSPRKHVWTLMAGQSEIRNTNTNCPCNTGSNVNVQSIVGSHYFCESGNPTNLHTEQILFTMDPLWDGNDCRSLEVPCCAGLPWFHRIFDVSTTDYIELRACDNAETNREDAIVSLYEIYVQ